MRDSFLLSGTSTVWQNLRPCLAARKELELNALSRIPLSPPSHNVTLSSIPISRVRKRFHSLLVAVCTFPYSDWTAEQGCSPVPLPNPSSLPFSSFLPAMRCCLALCSLSAPQRSPHPPPPKGANWQADVLQKGYCSQNTAVAFWIQPFGALFILGYVYFLCTTYNHVLFNRDLL